jgi:hypothetical protein
MNASTIIKSATTTAAASNTNSGRRERQSSRQDSSGGLCTLRTLATRAHNRTITRVDYASAAMS